MASPTGQEALSGAIAQLEESSLHIQAGADFHSAYLSQPEKVSRTLESTKKYAAEVMEVVGEHLSSIMELIEGNVTSDQEQLASAEMQAAERHQALRAARAGLAHSVLEQYIACKR
ncbi:hypothetical protein WJX74_007762 [Apatococcus lobatus]|uniref:Mediator of RNA polymerase II transcription subunit 21 n=1 Tax=Apatococcus lobatus TaxID=904363 RepID=A0AAW1RTL7_9CHLO